MYLFGILENSRLRLVPHQLGPNLPSRSWDCSPQAGANRLRGLVDAGGFYSCVVIAVPIGEPQGPAWEDHLWLAGFEKLPGERVAELVGGFTPVLGEDFHPEWAGLWSYGRVDAGIEELALELHSA